MGRSRAASGIYDLQEAVTKIDADALYGWQVRWRCSLQLRALNTHRVTARGLTLDILALGRRGWERGEARMEIARGTVYQPEDIALMKTVLDEAATILPVAKRTSTMKVKLAARILASAAKGERDPI
jgi:hypothetical protein